MRATSWPWLLAAAALFASTPTRDADWPIIQGTKEGQPKHRPIRPIGLI
jgi:hypothetical protein